MLRLLRALVDKSLVVAFPEGSETRYRLLETIGQFAEEQPEGETAAALPSLFEWAFGVADTGYAAMIGNDREAWSHRLDLEVASIRRALDWTLANRDAHACRLVLNLTRYWFVRGRYVEGQTALETILPLAGPGTERAEIGNVLGVFRNRLGSAAGAEEAYRAALAEPELPDAIRVRCLTNLAIMLTDSAKYPEAATLCDEALRTAERIGDRYTVNATRLNRAQISLGQER